MSTPYVNSKAQSGRGTILSIGPRTDATGTPVYVVIGECKTSSSGGNKWGTEDVTNFQSGVDMEFRKTIRDNGSKSLTFNRVSGDAGQVALKAAYNDPDGVYLFQVQYPKAVGQTSTGDLDTFAAIVESADYTIEFNKIITGTCSLKQSGATTTVLGS